MTNTIKNVSVLTALWFAAVCARADVTLNAIFDEHMVLQRDIPVAVYGKAEPEEKVEPGEKVTVDFARSIWPDMSVSKERTGSPPESRK